jgi:hypothetical protein
MNPEKEAILLALKAVSEALDELVGYCIAGTVSKGDIQKARAYLPPYCKNAYRKK